jgi:hypothetical protein
MNKKIISILGIIIAGIVVITGWFYYNQSDNYTETQEPNISNPTPITSSKPIYTPKEIFTNSHTASPVTNTFIKSPQSVANNASTSAATSTSTIPRMFNFAGYVQTSANESKNYEVNVLRAADLGIDDTVVVHNSVPDLVLRTGKKYYFYTNYDLTKKVYILNKIGYVPIEM